MTLVLHVQGRNTADGDDRRETVERVHVVELDALALVCKILAGIALAPRVRFRRG